MRVDEIAELTRCLSEAGLNALVVDGSDGSLRLILAADDKAAAGVTVHIDGRPIGRIIKARCAGIFTTRHPARSEPVARPGDSLQRGAIIGFLGIGPLLSPVTIPADAILLGAAVPDGTRVGYGQALISIVTEADTL